MIKLITALLEATTAYLNFKRETDLENRLDRSRHSLSRIHDEIDTLRTHGTPDSTRRADQLRAEYATEVKHLRYLKALRPDYSQAPSERARADH